MMNQNNQEQDPTIDREPAAAGQQDERADQAEQPESRPAESQQPPPEPPDDQPADLAEMIRWWKESKAEQQAAAERQEIDQRWEQVISRADQADPPDPDQAEKRPAAKSLIRRLLT